MAFRFDKLTIKAQEAVQAAQEVAADNPALSEPTAMAVATVDPEGLPDVREVLMRFLTPAGAFRLTPLSAGTDGFFACRLRRASGP